MSVGSNISAEDRRAAAAVTVSGSGHKFEIQLGHLCNNRCVFCSSGQLTAMKIARPIPIEPIIEALEEARAAGATHLTFLGGEPTIHKRFLEAVAKAVELGFQHIVIFTNGVMFPHPGFIDSVTALGNFEWRISIQGATEEAHVATTERPESFKRIVHGLKELQRRGQLVTANMCINERSYRSLPHYPELIQQYGVSQLHIDIVRPASTGERNEAYLRDIMPRYTDMAPYYTAMLEGFEKSNPDFDINVGNLPYCILPAWASRVHHGGEQTVTKSSDGEGLEDAMNKYEWQSSLRTHLPSCESCVLRSRCTGIFRVYLEMYGGDEFQPLTRDALLALDPQWRNFVLLAEPFLSPLRTALTNNEMPPGWRLRQEVSEDRLRRVDMLFTHQSGAGCRLRFLAPGKSPSPIVRTSAYDLEADADISATLVDLGNLFEWVVRHLATAPELGETPTLESNASERAWSRSVLERGRQRVSLLANRLQTRFVLPLWTLDKLKWSSDSSAEIVARGPAESCVALRFGVSVRGNRSQIGVDFQIADSTDSAVAKTVVDAMIRHLQTAPPVNHPSNTVASPPAC